MAPKVEAMSRQTARDLLAKLRQTRAQGEAVELLLIDGSDWIHPKTRERMGQAAALESALEGLLEARAGMPW